MHVLLLLAALAANPQPSPTPLKTIVNIRSREICTVLRENLAPAIGGLLANDKLTIEGQVLLNRLGGDAQGEYADDLGGEGSVTSMDNERIGNVVSAMVANIERIERLLSQASYRGKDQTEGAAFDEARSGLERVLARQKDELNILSFVTVSNEGNSVLAKRDPTGGVGRPGPSEQADLTPVTLPKALWTVRQVVRRTENDAAPAVSHIVEVCR